MQMKALFANHPIEDEHGAEETIIVQLDYIIESGQYGTRGISEWRPATVKEVWNFSNPEEWFGPNGDSVDASDEIICADGVISGAEYIARFGAVTENEYL